MEGVLVSAKKDGSTITVTVVSDEQGPLHLPGRPARARQVHDHDPRRRLRARRPHGSDGRGRPDRQGRPQARQDQEHLADSSPTPNGSTACPARTAEVLPERLRRLPHAAAGVLRLAYAPRSSEQIFQPHGHLFAGQHADASAAAAARTARRAAARACGAGARPPRSGSTASTSAIRDTQEYASRRCRGRRDAPTKVIITEYDLPRKEAQPHDVIVDQRRQWSGTPTSATSSPA